MTTLYICENKNCPDNQNAVAYSDERKCDKCGSWRRPVQTKLKEMERNRFANGLKIQTSELIR